MTTIPQRHGQTNRRTDRQMDGQTTSRGNTALCVASRGKKTEKQRKRQLQLQTQTTKQLQSADKLVAINYHSECDTAENFRRVLSNKVA